MRDERLYFQYSVLLLKILLCLGGQDTAFGTRGYRLRAVLKKPTSEHYMCLSQGQANSPAQLMAMHGKNIHKVNIMFAKPRPGYLPSPAYGPTL